MTVDYTEDGSWKFSFIPEYADCIARAASVWARLEYDVSVSIWKLADLRPAMGACITSQIFTLKAKLDCLIALSKLRKLDDSIVKKLNKFGEPMRVGQDKRNRILHDMWLTNNHDPSTMGHLRITAAKALEFRIKAVILPELAHDLETLENTVTQFAAIRKDIEAALPQLPELAETELFPILEATGANADHIVYD